MKAIISEANQPNFFVKGEKLYKANSSGSGKEKNWAVPPLLSLM